MKDIDLNNIIFNKVLSANACINCDIFPISSNVLSQNDAKLEKYWNFVISLVVEIF